MFFDVPARCDEGSSYTLRENVGRRAMQAQAAALPVCGGPQIGSVAACRTLRQHLRPRG